MAFFGLLRHRTRVDVVQRCLFGVLQADVIRRADGILVMTLAPPRVCVLMAGLSWGAMIAHAPQVCSPTQPESNQSDSGQVRL